MRPMRAVAVIPARVGSKRLPGKVLASLRGEPLVLHVWRRLQASETVDAVYVATDDDAVAEIVHAAGGRVLRTTGAHRCGTDRVAEAIRLVEADIVVNVQADCANLDVAVVDQIVTLLRNGEHAVVTPVATLSDAASASSADCVKAVVDSVGRGIYFSRSQVPHGGPWLRHVGVYGFHRSALEAFSELEPSPLELSEDLEQLRLIENGLTIQTILTNNPGTSVDTASDLRRLQTLHSSPVRGPHA